MTHYDLLEVVQLDEQSNRNKLALRVGVQEQIGISLACGRMLCVGSRSVRKRITHARVSLDVADDGTSGLNLLCDALQRFNERLECHARARLRVNGCRHGRSLLVHMRFQSCCAPPDFDLVIMRVLVVVVMVVIMAIIVLVGMFVRIAMLMVLMRVLVIVIVASAGAIRTVIFANLTHASHPQSCRAEQRQRVRWHSSAQWAHLG